MSEQIVNLERCGQFTDEVIYQLLEIIEKSSQLQLDYSKGLSKMDKAYEALAFSAAK